MIDETDEERRRRHALAELLDEIGACARGELPILDTAQLLVGCDYSTWSPVLMARQIEVSVAVHYSPTASPTMSVVVQPLGHSLHVSLD